MKRPLSLLCILLATLALNSPAMAATLKLPPYIQKQLQLPENKIDIGIAALTFAKDFYPNLDIAAYSRKIDDLAEKVKWVGQGTKDPERRVRGLNTVLFLREKFYYDHSSAAREDQGNCFLNGILDTKLGICFTMPLLYMAVAQRAGYPIYPVCAPDHLFLRYSDPSFSEQNIEATSGGKYFSDQSYAKDFSVSDLGKASGSYLRTLTNKEFLSHLLAANAYIHAKNGKTDKAILYLETAIQLSPRFADHYDNLARAYQAKSQTLSGEQSKSSILKAQQYAAKAKALGFVSPEVIALGRKTRGQ